MFSATARSACYKANTRSNHRITAIISSAATSEAGVGVNGVGVGRLPRYRAFLRGPLRLRGRYTTVPLIRHDPHAYVYIKRTLIFVYPLCKHIESCMFRLVHVKLIYYGTRWKHTAVSILYVHVR